MSVRQTSKVVCPSCSRQYAWRADVAGKTVQCKCGAALAVPEKPPQDALPSRVQGPQVGKSDQVFQLIALTVGLAIVIAVVIAGVRLYRASASPAPPDPPGIDGRVARLSREVGAHEVIQWLHGNEGRGVVAFYWTHEKTEKVAQGWYQQGAKQVLAFGNFWTNCLAIELPDDKDKRQYFFDYVNHFGGETLRRMPPQVDVGQKYVVIDFVASSLNPFGTALP